MTLQAQSAIFEIKPGRHYVAMWMVYWEGGNWQAAMFRDLPEGKWHLTYRFRYYTDARTGLDNEDKFSVYQAEGKDSTEETRDEMSKAVDEMAALTALAMDAHSLDYLDINTDDPEKIGAMLQNMTGKMHITKIEAQA